MESNKEGVVNLDQSASLMETPGQLRAASDLAPIQQDAAAMEQEAKSEGLAERRGLKSLPALESVPRLDLNDIPSTPVRILTGENCLWSRYSLLVTPFGSNCRPTTKLQA